MALFSMNYNKPGPGVEKDEPKKPPFFLFFEVLKRKFWHILKVNLLYAITSIPAIAIALVVSAFFLQKINLDNFGFADFYVRVFVGALLVLLSLIAIGPFHAGFTYILRNYSREEHSFIWDDFKEHTRKNFKQGMIITIIDCIALFLLAISLNFYTSLNNAIGVIASSFVILTLVVFAIMHLYIYPMLVTYDLGVKDIYKNALIFSIIKLPMNLLILALNVIIAFITFYQIIIGLVLYILITPSFMELMNNFYVDRVMKKYLLKEDR